MNKAGETANLILLGKQVDCFSCKFASGDLGCCHPAWNNYPVDLYGYCKHFEYVGDDNMAASFYAGLKYIDRYMARKNMKWEGENEN